MKRLPLKKLHTLGISEKMFRNEKSKYFPEMMESSKHLREISGKRRVWKLIPKPGRVVLEKLLFLSHTRVRRVW